eukprot:TRINITY_DN8788_c0_g1_i5.p1 TRINITY_DN8788_c0_g1~~TRINITY_DN8788_c0_g1_i5.p1  ORF type:complete len:193 (-),score=27.70 TRINITY_DN8788_c0_g1_i5:386-964(-)
MILHESAENFAINKGGQLAIGAYCENSAYYLPLYNIGSEEQFQGIVLIGDSLHHFPPSFGQGVNAAFEDALVLSEILERNNNGLKNSLEEYEKNRTVDARALVEMQQTVSFGRFKILNIFFLIFSQFERFLYGILPQVLPRPSGTYINDESLRYSEAKELKERARKTYYGILYGIVFAVGLGITSVFRLVLA